MWLQPICKGTFSFKRNPKLQAKPESFLSDSGFAVVDNHSPLFL